ncbi:MAG TPA: alpha/beta hydrolase [Methylocella sp.]|nr:alpha/beta hydrolase [Methylocella sp.]
MELSIIEGNPQPPGATVLAVATRDKKVLRTAYWSCGENCAGTIAILQGRMEFIEKYFEVIGELLARNFDVAILDWRGQGGSARLTKNPRKGHVGDFRAYQRDLDAFVEEVLAIHCRPPWFALAHSMGGAIALANARRGRSPFARMVLTSPMVDLYGLRFRRTLRFLVRSLVYLGQGRLFLPFFGGAKSAVPGPFEGNILTSDEGRYARTAAIIEAAPELSIGAPTIGWTSAAFRIMRRFKNPEFSRRLLTPVLIVAGGADRLADTAAAEEFASRLKAGKCIVLKPARHEVLMETDPLRELFWAAFDAFLPGEHGQSVQPADAAVAS